MSLARTVTAEVLDHLPVDDPAAIRSRRDLRVIHRAMGTRSILRRAMRGIEAKRAEGQLRLLELGAGEGKLLLDRARGSKSDGRGAELTLLDRQAVVDDATLSAYAACGWKARARIVDVFAWAAEPVDPGQRWDLVVANLFMHHFEAPELRQLLAAIEARADCFVAIEPRRGRLALAASHLVVLLGANAVTREDAVLSVRAGFTGDELSRLWPGRRGDWRLTERSAWPFSHCFVAERREAG
ncbi:conserved hypothetical protein [Burkholderiales bacterium 8X]|nr:conserved hypothetical protein [Burkholderiales bacterium 8X]